MKLKNNPDWLNKGPWYKKYICSKLHGTFSEYFIINDRTDRCNIRCYITAHGKQQPTYVDDTSSGVGIATPKN